MSKNSQTIIKTEPDEDDFQHSIQLSEQSYDLYSVDSIHESNADGQEFQPNNTDTASCSLQLSEQSFDLYSVESIHESNADGQAFQPNNTDSGSSSRQLTEQPYDLYSVDPIQKSNPVGQACQPNNTNSGSSKSGARKLLTPYTKKRLLKHLKTNGCSASSFEKAAGWLKKDTQLALDYFNLQAKLAQKYISEECGSLCFENVALWLHMLEEAGLNEFCDFEPALLIKTIADNEQLPSAKELNGIDLKSLYKFLGNALMGLPQPALDAKSAKFLVNEFQALINDVNSDWAEQETMQIKFNLLEESKPVNVSKCRGKMSLDPLAIDDGVTKYL